MAYNPNIQLGAPPLLWSDMNEVLVQINQNFDSLSAGGGGGPVDFNTLDTNVSPTIDDGYSLGTDSKQWKSVHVADYSTVPGQELNGLWAGTAQIKGIGGIIDLPIGSTIDGSLIIDPNKTTFKIIAVAGQGNVIADTFTSTLNIEGVDIQVTTDPLTNKVIFTSTAIRSVAGSAAISVTGTQDLTVTNTGVTSLTNTTALPSGRTAGAGINVSTSTGNIDITNTGILGVSAGFGISASTDAPSGVAAISVNPASVVTNSYRNFLVSGQTTLAANGVADSMTIASGYGIVLTTSTLGSDTLTVALDQKHLDINGSIFADDSTILVDAVSGVLRGNLIGSVFADDSSQIIDGNSFTVYGNIEATTLRTSEAKIALGFEAGRITQGIEAIAIGKWAGETNQGLRGIAIGFQAGWNNQQERGIAIGSGAGVNNQGAYAIAIGQDTSNINSGANSIAIGQGAGGTGQGEKSIAIGFLAGVGTSATFANSIILNASGSPVSSLAAGFYVSPIRTAANGTPLMYNSTTKEITYSNVLEFIGSTISTSDSSSITVDVLTTFNSDVVVENDIQLSTVESAIRGTNKIKFVPSSADELSYNVRLDVYSESTIEPRLALDTPDGVDLTLSSGMAGIVISKINGRVNLAAGNNAFIVRENGSWAMTPLDAPPISPTVGMYIADCTNWDPASKANGRPYPVWYDGVVFNALY